MCPIIHISTDYVFNGSKETPYLENDKTNPINIYGKTKYYGELEISSYNPRNIIIRTSWLFSQFNNNFLHTILRLSSENDSINIVSDQIGGPTSVNDLSLAITTIAKNIFANKDVPWGIFHFSGYPYVSWKEFAQAIVKYAYEYKILSKKTIINGIKTEEYLAKATRPKFSMLDNSKIHNEFSIKPSNWKNELIRILSNYGN
jgi:dTDP-4-dehydrorhamnose reductase